MKLSILAIVSTLSCVAVSVACGSSSNKGAGGGDSGTTGGEGGVGEGGGGDSGSDGSSGGTLPYFGSLAASRTASGIYTIAGDFFATFDAGTPTACPAPSVESGSCCYTPPPVASDAGESDAGTIALVSAGVITFTDGTTPLAAISPSATSGAYEVGSDKNVTVKWTPGDKITVSAAGDVVKAFSGSLTTVDDFADVTPTLSLTAETAIPIASNLDVTWTASTATHVQVLLTAVKGKAGDGSILCSVADSAGTVSVPTALLSKLSTGDVGTITLTRTASNTVTGSNVTVELVGTATSSGLVKYQ